MKDYNPEADDITDKVKSLIHIIFKEYQSLGDIPKDDSFKGAAWIAFHLNYDYFHAARDELIKNRVLSAGSLVRTNFENVVDLFYIYTSPQKSRQYADAYVKSMYGLNKLIAQARLQSMDEVSSSRLLKKANPWTRTNIEQRMEYVGKSMTTTYDMLSYFSHPNPASILYMGQPALKKGQINLLKQSNCINALHLIRLVLNHSDITKVTHSDTDVLFERLGLGFSKNP